MKKSLIAPVAICALALSLSSCASAPGTTTATSAASKASVAASGSSFKACMVSDSGGFDDKSFNQTSHDGLVKAKTELGIETNQIQSSADADYAKNIQSMVDSKCNMVVGVGFKLADAVEASAKANPNVKYAVVDSALKNPQPNVKPLLFNTDESSFLAGYLAAAQSQTHKVGTFGGMKIPSVTIFMDGFSQGVDYYSKNKNVPTQVLGWDVAKQDGQFVPGSNPFVDVAAGKTTATNLTTQGADVVFPVAGNAGQGALQVAQESGGKISTIWVDTDGCKSAANYCPVIMSSVYKGMDVAVFDAIKAAKDGSFTSTAYVGTLKNAGTGISPYNQFDSKISAATKAEIDTIKKGIIDGTIKVTSVSANK